jgi:DNA gyrase/topoisomerase IV subunit B
VECQGIGEMNAEWRWEMTVKLLNRTVGQVTLEDAKQVVEVAQALTSNYHRDTILPSFFHQLWQRHILCQAVCLIEYDGES